MIPENGTKNHSLWKKRRKKKFNKVFILLIVLVYIVSRTTPILTENSNKFHTITYGTLEDQLSFEGVILRDEKVLADNSRGLMVDSGERVARGQGITSGLNSPGPGTIAKNRDGFEDGLSLEALLQNGDPYLDTIGEILGKESVDTRDGIRLITGYHWGAVGAVSLEKAEEIQPGQKLWIQARDQRVRGKVVWIQEVDSRNNTLVLIQSNEYLEGVHEHRKLDFTLIKRKVEGLSVPMDAIYYLEGDAYITQRKAGEDLKVPVNIILADDQLAILSGDQFTDDQGEVKQTVSLYDEILLDQANPKGKDGHHE